MIKRTFKNVDSSSDFYGYTITATAASESIPKPWCEKHDENGKRVGTFFADWNELLGYCEFYGYEEVSD